MPTTRLIGDVHGKYDRYKNVFICLAELEYKDIEIYG
jgi:hypothetical protein